MARLPETLPPTVTADTGLRGRKKAKRRRDILRVAGALFNENGFDATTMADIATAVDVSPPTIFNYFGSKENILSALLIEGAAHERVQHLARPRPTGRAFGGILGDLMCDTTENTMRIAGKRVWRYAEANNIRRSDTAFRTLFAQLDLDLLCLMRTYLGNYDLVLRSGAKPDHGFLAHLIFDRWSARYFDYIKEDRMTLPEHFRTLREDAQALVDLLFDDAFARTSPLKPGDRPG